MQLIPLHYLTQAQELVRRYRPQFVKGQGALSSAANDEVSAKLIAELQEERDELIGAILYAADREYEVSDARIRVACRRVAAKRSITAEERARQNWLEQMVASNPNFGAF